MPFKDILSVVPGTGFGFNDSHSRHGITSIKDNTLVNSGDNCKVEKRNLLGYDSVLTIFVGAYEAKITDGFDVYKKKVKQLEFTNKMPEFLVSGEHGDDFQI